MQREDRGVDTRERRRVSERGVVRRRVLTRGMRRRRRDELTVRRLPSHRSRLIKTFFRERENFCQIKHFASRHHPSKLPNPADVFAFFFAPPHTPGAAAAVVLAAAGAGCLPIGGSKYFPTPPARFVPATASSSSSSFPPPPAWVKRSVSRTSSRSNVR